MIKWMLRKNPALWGDLLEERASGRSRLWFCRQVLVAVGREFFKETRQHPFLTLRAVAITLLSYFAVSAVSLLGYAFMYGLLFPRLVNLDETSFLLLIPLIVLPSVAAGWILARTHRNSIEVAIVAIVLVWVPISMPINTRMSSAQIIGLLAGALLGTWRPNKIRDVVLK